MKMKTLFVISISLVTQMAYAEPTDNDPLSALDVGSTIEITSKINIPNHNKVLYQDGLRFNYFSQVSNGRPFCQANVYKADNTEYSQDISIAVGRRLVLKMNSPSSANNNTTALQFGLADGGVLVLGCSSGIIDGVAVALPTIGQFKQAMKNIADLTLAPPLSL